MKTNGENLMVENKGKKKNSKNTKMAKTKFKKENITFYTSNVGTQKQLRSLLTFMRLKFQPQKPQNSYQFFYLFSPKENFLLLRTYSTKNLIPLPSKATLAILDSKKK